MGGEGEGEGDEGREEGRKEELYKVVVLLLQKYIVAFIRGRERKGGW